MKPPVTSIGSLQTGHGWCDARPPKALRCHCSTHLCSQQRDLKAGARHHKLLHRHGVARGDEQVLQQPSQGQAMWCLNDDDRGSAAQSEQPSHEAQDGSASKHGSARTRRWMAFSPM